MKKYFLIVIIASLLVSCNKNKETASDVFKNLEWITGNWMNTNEDGTYYENWTRENDSTYSGESYFMFGKDTIFKEDINILIRQDTIYYIPIVSNQNDGKPIEFKLIHFDNNTSIFENKFHDFPQRIIYTHTKSDSLHAWIEGTTNGESKKIDFKMGRKQ